MSRIRFSSLKGRPVRGPSGNDVGKVHDCVVRLLDPGALPNVTGLLLRLAGQDVFISMEDFADLGPEAVMLSSNSVDTRPFERRPGEVLLGRDVVGRGVIDVVEARLIRVGDVILEGQDGTWRVVAVTSSIAFSPVRALRRMLRREPPVEEVDWARIEPLTAHVPSAARQRPLLRVATLRPADIADIVEQASHEEGREILEAVRGNRELEADVFEELNEEHQVEFARERSDADVAALLAGMEPDDAADLLLKLDQERRGRILELLPDAQREAIRRLLAYNPETAGGLMNTEFVALGQEVAAQDAIQTVRAMPEAPTTLTTVFALEGELLAGAIRLVELLRAEPDTPLRELGDRHPVAVFPDADLPAIAVEMADYDLAALPVVDERGRLLGVVTYDDLVEAMVPDEWRWRGEASQEHRFERAPTDTPQA